MFYTTIKNQLYHLYDLTFHPSGRHHMNSMTSTNIHSNPELDTEPVNLENLNMSPASHFKRTSKLSKSNTRKYPNVRKVTIGGKVVSKQTRRSHWIKSLCLLYFVTCQQKTETESGELVSSIWDNTKFTNNDGKVVWSPDCKMNWDNDRLDGPRCLLDGNLTLHSRLIVLHSNKIRNKMIKSEHGNGDIRR